MFFNYYYWDHAIKKNTNIANNINVDIKVNFMRGCFLLSSYNNLKESSVHSSISFIPYIERMETQNNNLLQTDQVKSLSIEKTALSYETLKIRETLTNDKTSNNKNMMISYSNSQDANIY